MISPSVTLIHSLSTLSQILNLFLPINYPVVNHFSDAKDQSFYEDQAINSKVPISGNLSNHDESISDNLQLNNNVNHRLLRDRTESQIIGDVNSGVFTRTPVTFPCSSTLSL